MKYKRLHHVGIIMPTMEKAKAFLERFGLEEDYTEFVEAYHSYCLFTKYGEGESPIELVIPESGVLKDFNNGKGGMHHIAFEVDDVREVKRDFESQGLDMLEEEPATGAGGIIVNFLRPRHGCGVLVEFVEKTK